MRLMDGVGVSMGVHYGTGDVSNLFEDTAC